MSTTEQWVVLELSPRGEGEDPEILVRSIQHTVKGADVFVPALTSQVADEKVVKYLWEGYCFIRRQQPDSVYLRLEGTRYVQKVLTQPGPGRDRKLATISSRDVNALKGQIKVETDQGIQVGDEIRITSGPYKGICGRVIDEISVDDTVQIYIKLRSKEAIVTLPRSFLKFVAHSTEALPVSVKDDRIAKWRAWHQRVLRLFTWPDDALVRAEGRHAEWDQVHRWVTSGGRIERFIRAINLVIELESVRRKHRDWTNLARLSKENERLQQATHPAGYDRKALQGLNEKKGAWLQLQSITLRLETLGKAVGTLERTLIALESPVTQNVIIDGYNLAFRCMHALSQHPMTDKSGRPTSVLFGFLQSLGVLKKRFHEANFYVAWDGGRARRATKFVAYKANREPFSIENHQITTLKTVLTSLGVGQLYVQGEEADDLVAALVKGPLKGQRNLVVSTDRDYLQLVTETDSLLCPRTPSKNDPRTEVLFNPSEVMGQYGVEPSRMVELRALLGDPSDNIPRVPKVQEKVLLALIQTYGSVEALYKSKLPGLSTNNYTLLRGFEKQARLNVELMTLISDQPCGLIEGSPNRSQVIERLAEYDVKSDSIVGHFLGSSSAKT